MERETPMRFVNVILLIVLLIGSTIAEASYDQRGFQYLSPQPHATEVSRFASILVRFTELLPENINIQVTGENGAPYTGHIKIASDAQTVIYKPHDPFTPGENVRVNISNAGIQFEYSFLVSGEESRDVLLEKDAPDMQVAKMSQNTATMGEPQVMPNGVSVPSYFPRMDISVNDNPADGYIFINNWGDPFFNMILEPDGSPIWYQISPADQRDMKVQKNGLLTMLVRNGYPFGQGHIGLDNTYSVVDSFYATDGCSTDEHELQILEDGSYFVFGLRTLTKDMSKIVPGGQKSAKISETGIQGFTPEGELIFHWRAWDNFDPVDMIGYSPDDQPTDASFRFPHMNSLDIDDDGHIILSSKRLSEVTKINRQTGEIIWRLGGANNEFEFIDDPLKGFYNQHSVRALGNGHYTIFDNGCLHNPQVSRALEYKIDTTNMTATLVWSFIENPPTYAYHMGNVQRLPNGNTFINWAVNDLPKAQEVTPDGRTVYSTNFADRYKTYRAFKFPWNGVAKAPVLIVEQQIDNVTLLFNKFGDKNVDHYNIYVGRGLNPTEVVATSRSTLAKLYDLENKRRYFVRVTAVDQNGVESDFSNQEQFVVNQVTPGEEMVANGGFTDNKNSWDWLVRNGAAATWGVVDNAAKISISNGGGADSDIQLTQSGITLIQGREYIFEFDAWADAPRTVEAKIAQNGGSFINYSRIGVTPLSRSLKRFRYRFTMNEPTDSDARIVFNAGTSTTDMYVTNVSAKMLGETAVDESNEKVVHGFQLLENYPNPFNAQTTLRFFMPERGDVTLNIYNILGERIREFTAGTFEFGEQTLNIRLNALSSGVYLYRLSARNKDGVHSYSHISKMTLLR